MGDTEVDHCIRVVFRVKKHCNEPTSEKVGIVGNHARLGHWNTDLAPRTCFIGHGQWQLETWLPKAAITSFKLFCVDPRSQHITHFEDGPNRELSVKERPLFIELEYGQQNIQCIRPMTSQLTSTGNPLVLPGLKKETMKYFPTAGDWEMDDFLDDQEYYIPELNFSCGKLFVQVKSPPKTCVKDIKNIHKCTEDSGYDVKIDMIKYEDQKRDIPTEDFNPVEDKQAVFGDQMDNKLH